MITERAVKVVLEMLPTGRNGSIEHDSAAYWDLLREHTADLKCYPDVLDNEVKEVLAELGRGLFSVLETTDE